MNSVLAEMAGVNFEVEAMADDLSQRMKLSDPGVSAREATASVVVERYLLSVALTDVSFLAAGEDFEGVLDPMYFCFRIDEQRGAARMTIGVYEYFVKTEAAVAARAYATAVQVYLSIVVGT